MIWIGLLGGIVIGVLVTIAVMFAVTVTNPACPATIQSGEQCIKDVGHPGPHRTRVRVGYSSEQGYAWEDPSNGLHKVGFFLN